MTAASSTNQFIFTGIEPEEVEIISHKEIGLEIPEIIMSDLIPKSCYFNAALVGKFFQKKGMEYVEGETILFGISIVHAWNFYKGKHFDLTAELFWEKEEQSPVYFPAVRGRVCDLRKAGYDFGSPTDIFTQWLNKPETKAGNKDSVWYKLTNGEYLEN